MNTVYVLIMLWGAASSQSGIVAVQQEFTSKEKCEFAREHLAKKSGDYMILRSQGCFPK